MSAWKPLGRIQEEASPAEPPVAESADVKAEGIDDLGTVCREWRMRLEVDGGTCIPVSLIESNANHILGLTRRAREHSEREMAGVLWVRNFGSEPRWSGEDR